MADIKFSCSQCGQHISCDAPWAGHQIQCPACQANLTVPQAQSAPAAPAISRVSQPPAPSRAKLSAGVTQVARSTSPGPAPQKRLMPRPPKSRTSLLGYAILGLVLAVVGITAYNYVPALLNKAKDVGSATTGSATTPASGGGGPLD